MRTVAAAALFAVLAAPATRAEEPPRFQAALHGGYRAGGSLEDSATDAELDFEEGGAFAIALEMRYERGDDRYFQLWYSRQESEVDDGAVMHDADIEYLHLGGTVPLAGSERAQPYFAAGIGATRLSSPAADTGDRTYFSGSLALGVAFPLAQNVSLRLEARGYLTAVDTNSAIFCRSDAGGGICSIFASSSTLWQAEALAGIAFRF